jgi:anti-sigma regulatory factor (Ser/Thr protein kinase)
MSSKKVRINISPTVEFREILKVLNNIHLPDYGIDHDNMKYAVMELLNNSLRAHREKRVNKAIITTFNSFNSHLTINIKDYGGGFDPGKLPYDLEKDHREINPQSSSFIEYREKNNYLRFGMGLLLARRTFAYFHLSFFDNYEKQVKWESGEVAGTIIRLSTGVKNYEN